jgi:hypothetical protein
MLYEKSGEGLGDISQMLVLACSAQSPEFNPSALKKKNRSMRLLSGSVRA